MIKIDFSIEHDKYGVYKDAIHLEDNHTLSENEIEAIKQERYNNWINIIENPPEQEEIIDVEQTLNINGVIYRRVTTAIPENAETIEFNKNIYYKV